MNGDIVKYGISCKSENTLDYLYCDRQHNTFVLTVTI
jgi:hypothetical protein